MNFSSLDIETFEANFICLKNAIDNAEEIATKFNVSKESLIKAYRLTNCGQTGDTIKVAQHLDNERAKHH